MWALGKMKKDSGLDAWGLTGLLAQDAQEIQQGASGGLSGLLGMVGGSGDGATVPGKRASLLGGLFGKKK